MNPKWVELLSDHPTHGAKGKRFELPEKDADTLIAAGVAKASEKPDDSTAAQAKEVVETISKVMDTKIAALETRLEDRAKSHNVAITKNFGSLVPNPAEGKDKALEARGGFKSANHWLAEVRKAGTPGAQVDERLYKLEEKQQAEFKSASGMNTNNGEQGGFLALAEISQQIEEIAFEQASFLDRTDLHRLTGSSLTLKAVNETSRLSGSRRGGVRAYWLAQADQYTSSKPKFRELTLNPHKIGVFYYVTDEQADDTVGYNLDQKLAQYAGEEIAWEVDEAILSGDGVGKPRGILNSSAIVTVTKEGSQTATTFNFQNAIKMYARMLPSSIPYAAWYVNIDTLPNLLAMVGPTASGSAMVMLNGQYYPTASAAPFGTLLGRPIIPTEHNKTLGTVGDVLFADMRWYAAAVKGGVNSAMSIHLRFDYGERAFRFDYRVDGQTWNASAMTPAQGTNTLAPFVVVETR